MQLLNIPTDTAPTQFTTQYCNIYKDLPTLHHNTDITSKQQATPTTFESIFSCAEQNALTTLTESNG